MKFLTTIKIMSASAILALGMSGAAHSGAIYLTGHDVLLHGGQNGYDAVILDYLRDGAAKSGYNIAVVGSSGVGSARFSGGVSIPGLANGAAISLIGTTLSGYAGATFYDAGTANWTDVLKADALVILSFTNCGGCSLTTAGSSAINSNSAAIATAFNAGMDIWGLSGATLSTYYDFLPAGVVATGSSISGSSGFTTTAAGGTIGISSNMINGFPTHNQFPTFASAFTVFESRSGQDISIGIRSAVIGDGSIVTTTTNVPEPATLILFGLGLAGLGFTRRRRNQRVNGGMA